MAGCCEGLSVGQKVVVDGAEGTIISIDKENCAALVEIEFVSPATRMWVPCDDITPA